MQLVVGLGNPGARYADTRHNVGYRVAVAFAAAHDIALVAGKYDGQFGLGSVEGREVGVLLPSTFMNRSGDSVAAALNHYPSVDPARDLVVAVDDLDLPFGRLRVRPGGSSGGHRGLESLIGRLQGDAFARLRFGIGRPDADVDPVAFVLEAFDADEEAALPEAITRATRAVEVILGNGVEAAMSRFNGPSPSPPEPPEDSGRSDAGGTGDLN